MQTDYTIIGVDGSEEKRLIDWPREPGYDRLKALLTPLLDGGRLEHVSVLWEERPMDMFVDEDFRDKGLPRNEKATAIYRNYTLSREKDRDPETLPGIAGPAILFRRRVWY